jgi:hypothetical protein
VQARQVREFTLAGEFFAAPNRHGQPVTGHYLIADLVRGVPREQASVVVAAT